MIYPVNSLPIVQVDRQTSKPLSVRRTVSEEKGKMMSLEQTAKNDKYRKEAEKQGDEIGEKLLDQIVTKKGEESHITRERVILELTSAA